MGAFLTLLTASLLAAPHIGRHLSHQATAIGRRIMGMILAAIAMEMIVASLRAVPGVDGPLRLERIDGSKNISRYYVLAITPTLFGESALVREWGRIGTSVQRRVDLHANGIGAGEALHAWLRRKVQRGYVVEHQT